MAKIIRRPIPIGAIDEFITPPPCQLTNITNTLTFVVGGSRQKVRGVQAPWAPPLDLPLLVDGIS